MSSALVLFSGGQDSTTCLAWALSRYEHVETIGFDYGQQHRVEMDARQNVLSAIRSEFPVWGDKLGADRVITLDAFKSVTRSALLGHEDAELRDNLPATFVPGRNLVFLTYAGIVAEQTRTRTLVIGTCETDFSGYPDCRDNTMRAMNVALNLGMHTRLDIQTPLMWIDKAETWALADSLGGIPLTTIIRDHTHTCYRGVRADRYGWGYGCGKCDACNLRQRGWHKWSETVYEL
jgi:7-cyano-7-deazaguanine synthase